MAEPNEQVLAEAREYGETLTTQELLRSIERHHHAEGPGVPHETIEAYDRAAGEENILPFAEGQLTSTIEKERVTADGWRDADSYYGIDGDRVSLFPQRWHEQLGESDDLREYVAVIEEASAEEGTTPDLPQGGIGTGVPEELLLDVMAVIDGLTREEAKERLERDRRDGKLVQDADQHPDARVYLTEEAEAMRDDWLDY